tara:strand:- start:239 stop:514 length:276 start_codon:yes stop_codon:yes gene_type:complete
MKKRHIPVISFNEIDSKVQKPKVYKSLVEGVVEAMENNSNEIKLCEIKHANTYLTVNKNNWSSSLAKAMDFYIDNEQYEVCALIKELTSKL